MYTYNEIKHFAVEQILKERNSESDILRDRLLKDKVTIGMWLFKNGYRKKRIQVDKIRKIYYYKDEIG